MAGTLFIGRLEARPMGSFGLLRDVDQCNGGEEFYYLPTPSNISIRIPSLFASFSVLLKRIGPPTPTIQQMSEHIAMYAGSFDPITSGHLDVISRARTMFDRIIVGIGHNPDKQELFPFDDRVQMAEELVNQLVAQHPDDAPVSVEQYSGLTVDFAKNAGVVALLRGIRNVTDLAMETQLAITNRQVADIETVFIITGEAYAFTSSSLIRQIAALGGNVERLHNTIPPLVIERLKTLQNDPSSSLHTHSTDANME